MLRRNRLTARIERAVLRILIGGSNVRVERKAQRHRSRRRRLDRACLRLDRVRLKREPADRSDQRTVLDRRCANRLLLSVHFSGRSDAIGELNLNARGGLAGQLSESNDDLVPVLCLLHRLDLDLLGVGRNQREGPAQLAWVRWNGECQQRLVQSLRLPRHIALSPVTRVGSQGVENVMAAEVLRRLVLVTTPNARRVQQGQSNGIVVRLVRSELGVVKNGRTKRAARLRQVQPLVLRDFVLLGIVGAALDRAQLKVVGRLRVAAG